MTYGPRIDLTGKTFGLLTVIEYVGLGKWKCVCSCGNEVVTRGNFLRTGNTKSCGCLHDKRCKELHTKHGHLTHSGKSPHLYTVWVRVRNKCRNQNDKSYKSFGGAGIDMCDEWYDDFQAFYDWAYESGYSEVKENGKYTLIRRDKFDDFTPDNCTWGKVGTVDLPDRKKKPSQKVKQERDDDWEDLPDEIWRPIVGYEGLYEVSNCGRIRSLVFRNGASCFQRKKLLSSIDHGNGYRYVSLTSDGERKNHYVHRLVADAFVPNPNGCSVVDHIDFDRSNNSASNLQWLTQKENVQRSIPRMSKPRIKPMTNTGERYISKIKANGMYRVEVSGRTVGRFETLEEAIIARDAELKECNDEGQERSVR